MWRSLFVLTLIGCTPGQVKESGNDVISDYEWEPGATEPLIQNGEVYCTTGESGVVYRGYFKTQAGKQLVAIKTCKGILHMLSGRS